ncbi:hypothetical protein ES703_14944 [subsurface metagenome]
MRYPPDNRRLSQLNLEKYKQILHYIINSIGTIRNIGKTVLYKILYFCDFDFYELYEVPLIGETYRKIKYGPAPCNFDKIAKCLEQEGKVKRIKGSYKGYSQQKFISLKKPTTDLISKFEKELIDGVTQKLSRMNAAQISRFSHKDMPWRATGDKEIINYELVFYRTPEFSVRKYSDED